MKATDLNEFLQFMITNNFPVLIKGRPGIGKSDIVASVAETLNAKLIISHPVVSDPTDYKGLPFAGTDGSAHFMPFGELNELIHATEKTIFFLDDLGQAPVSVQAACMQLILARRINGHKISENVTFIAATNRKEDKAGVSGLLEPVKSRFASIIELETHTKDWVQWGLQNNMPLELIAFVRFKETLFEKFEATKELVNSISPRTVSRVGMMQNAGLKKSMEFEAFRGACGETFATEYCAFLKMFRDLPTIEQIILNPNTAPVSDDPSVLYAVSALIGAKMTKQNIGALLRYLNRIPKEYEIRTVQDNLFRSVDTALTKEYIQWSVDNHDLLS
jgi:hypothetical protein